MNAEDIKTIQDMLATKGWIDDNGTVVVPNDFFERLGRALNPPGQRSIIDAIVGAAEDDR